jgi:hypothetical protein
LMVCSSLSWRTCDGFGAQQGGDDHSETSGLSMFFFLFLFLFWRKVCECSVTSSFPVFTFVNCLWHLL